MHSFLPLLLAHDHRNAGGECRRSQWGDALWWELREDEVGLVSRLGPIVQATANEIAARVI